MIPNGWTIDYRHPCGALRLVNAQGHVTTHIPQDEGKRVRCPNCRWEGILEADEGGIVECPSCGIQGVIR